jgi:tagatose-1,6-bisphosphate aldolase non-catalytic subunit AgaZ/GatZ
MEIKSVPELNDSLTGWEELGYASKTEAMKHAAALWQAFVKAGFIKTPAQCATIVRDPRVWAMGRFIL